MASFMRGSETSGNVGSAVASIGTEITAEAAPAAAAAPAAPAAAKKNAKYYKEAEDFMKEIYPFINKECITILDGCFDKYWSINPNIIHDPSTAMSTVMFLYKEIKKYLEETKTYTGKSFKDGRNYLEMEATFGIDVCTSYLHFFVNKNNVFKFQHRLEIPRKHIEDLHLYLISLTDLMMRSWTDVFRIQELEDVDSHFHDDIEGMGPLSMAKREDTTESKVLTNMTAMARIILLTCERSFNKYAENLVKPYNAPYIDELSAILFKNGFEEVYYKTKWAEAGYQRILSLDDAPTMIKIPVAKMAEAEAAAAPAAPAAAEKNATYYKEAEDFMTKFYPFINEECITILDGCCDKNIEYILSDLYTNENVAVMIFYAEIKIYLSYEKKFKARNGKNYLEMEAVFGIDVCTSWLHFFVNKDENFEIKGLEPPLKGESSLGRLEELHRLHKRTVDEMMTKWGNSVKDQKEYQMRERNGYLDFDLGYFDAASNRRLGAPRSQVLAELTAKARTIVLTCERSSHKYAEKLYRRSPYIPYTYSYVLGLPPYCFRREYYTTWAEEAYGFIYPLLPRIITSGDMNAVWIASI